MRAVSLPRNNPIRHDNPITGAPGYGNVVDTPTSRFLSQRRAIPNREFGHSEVNSYVAKEILRTEGDSRETPNQSHFLPNLRGSIMNDSRAENRSVENWEEFMVRQSNVASISEQQRLKEDKLRAMKYRETLDHMVQEDKKRKFENKKEIMEAAQRQYTELEALSKMEKLKELEQKKHYSDDLKQLVKSKNEEKRNEIQQKYQQEMELKRNMDQLKQFENHSHLQKGSGQKQAFDEYKRTLGYNQQGYAEQTNNGYTLNHRQDFLGPKSVPNKEYEKKKATRRFY